MISADNDKMDKNAQSYLGKVRSNFLGTEFYLYDTGENPKAGKGSKDEIRS